MTLPADANGTADRLLDITARLAGCTIDDLRSDHRYQPVTAWRQAAMAVCQTHLGLSSTRTARAFGRADHTTALYARRVVDQRPDLAAMAERIVARLEHDQAVLDPDDLIARIERLEAQVLGWAQPRLFRDQ